MEIVTINTSDGLKLKALHYEGKDSCVLFIGGLDGNWQTLDFADVLAKSLNRIDIGFLFLHHRGSFQILNIRKEVGKYPILIGSALEKFEDCIYDIDASIEKIIKLGYKKIIVIAHSYGVDKFYYYMVKKELSIHKLVFINPPNLYHKCQKIFLNFNEKNVDSVSDNTLIQYANWVYKNNDSKNNMISAAIKYNFVNNIQNDTTFACLNCDKYVIIGSDDGVLKSNPEIVNILQDMSPYRVHLFIVEGANHIFIEKSKELAQLLVEVLKE